MNTSDLIVTVEACLVEVKGQHNEQGEGLKEAVRQLVEAVSLLEEVTNGCN